MWRSITDNIMICKICNKEYIKNYELSIHIRAFHKISIQIYYDNYLKKENEGICYCGKKTKFSGLVGYRLYCSPKCVSCDTKIKQKVSNTMFNKYGVYSSNQSELIKRKKEITSIKNYGVSNPRKSKIVQSKIEHTCLKKFGCCHPGQSLIVKQNIQKTWKEKYSEGHFFKTVKGKLLSRIKAIKETELRKLNNEPLMPNIGNQERICLNEIQQHTSYTIMRNDHSIANITGFFPDGHISELKLFIEFDERMHFIDDYKTYTQKDIDRQIILESIPGYIIFRVSEKQWEENKEQVINNFKQLVQELETT